MGAEIRILLVDDDEQVRPLLEYVLRDVRYVVDAAATVAGARAQLEQGRYEFAIVDARLPDGDGVEIADEAKRRGIKAVMLTGYSVAPENARHDYLFKPIRPDELVRAVARYVGKSRRG
jgi:DNA-binding NtrC family response regulator